jgi:catechol 2,3-dioxygenase
MHVQRLGHVVLKVRDIQRAEAFYAGVLGIPIISRITQPLHMTLFTLGDHHDFAVIELGDQATSPAAHATGLAHVAFKIGNSIDEYQSAKTDLEAADIEIIYEADRAYTKSIHLHDPDRNEVELYIDTSDTRKQHHSSRLSN